MRSKALEPVLYWAWRLGAALVQRLPTRLVYAGAVVGGELAFRHEVDEARWLPIPDALALLSYEHDRALVEAAPLPG